MKEIKITRQESGAIDLQISRDLLKSSDIDFVIFLQDSIAALQSQLMSIDMDESIT
jgi:hypothetical protein